MEPHQECAYDHIVVYDGHTTESRHRELDQMELKVAFFQKDSFFKSPKQKYSKKLSWA